MIKFIAEMREQLDGSRFVVNTYDIEAVTHQQAARIARQTHPDYVLLSTERAADV